uniref:Uncharacterized protein n=1 Tax=Trypanosoma vivax (strain Y486) TaxID=1055687 RepID=G0U885_TRYVY|nr:conserved hypothetical protein, fragment [Trypanosoma vivax Y486]
MESTLCFVCSRCGHPICSREDVITSAVANGTTENAFVYELEDLLNGHPAVPCYSGNEVTEVKAFVSDKLLSLPLPPAARLAASEAVAFSRRAAERENVSLCSGEDQTEGGSPTGKETNGVGSDAPRSCSDDVGSTSSSRDDASSTHDDSTHARGTDHSIANSLACFSRVKEARIDLICVKEDVLAVGLSLCTKDRSADAPTATPVESLLGESAAADVSAPPGTSGGEDSGSASTPSRLPRQSSRDSLIHSSLPTKWASHPGNLMVVEGFIKVLRRTKTARCPWFTTYVCSERLECPLLSFCFKPNEHTPQEAVPEKLASATNVTAPKEWNNLATQEPHQKKERREEENEGREEDGGHLEKHMHPKEMDEVDSFPTRFVGLELKLICERQWGLRDFQKRYQQSKDLETFRALFPEAEELESVHSRITALRMQSELYGSLLRKHKEQNDVQCALIQSQKERISSYEEKLSTMQQIIEAQRAQLEMQGRQIKHQEELLRNHRSQVMTQQQQIRVEQLLLSEQSRTIESQREQITIMKEQLQPYMKGQWHSQVSGNGPACSSSNNSATTTANPSSGITAAVANAPSTTSTLFRGSRSFLPPTHLMGITGRDVRARAQISTEENSNPQRATTAAAARSAASNVNSVPSESSLSRANDNQWLNKNEEAEELENVVDHTTPSGARISTSYTRGDTHTLLADHNLGLSERTAALIRRIKEEQSRLALARESAVTGEGRRAAASGGGENSVTNGGAIGKDNDGRATRDQEDGEVEMEEATTGS